MARKRLTRIPVIGFGSPGDPIRADVASGQYLQVAEDAARLLDQAAQSSLSSSAAESLLLTMAESQWKPVVRRLSEALKSAIEGGLWGLTARSTPAASGDASYIQQLQRLAFLAMQIANAWNAPCLLGEHVLMAIVQSSAGTLGGADAARAIELTKEVLIAEFCGGVDPEQWAEEYMTRVTRAAEGDEEALNAIWQEFESVLSDLIALHAGRNRFDKPATRQFGVSIIRDVVRSFTGTRPATFNRLVRKALEDGLERGELEDIQRGVDRE